MGIVCILGLVYLPNVWWGITLKVFLVYWLIGTIVGSFKDFWSDYETMGAFVTMQLGSFTAILLYGDIDVVRWIAVFIIVTGWFTMHSRIKGEVRERDISKTDGGVR
jgi:ABC-type amino acid transport system permease subunit